MSGQKRERRPKRGGLRRLPVVARLTSIQEARPLKRCLELKGGFFARGMRWRDYYKRLPVACRARVSAIRQKILAEGVRFTGREYESGGAAVPVFADGTYAFFTKHGYADLMAAIWSTAENTDYNYVHFLNWRLDADEGPVINTDLTRGGRL